MFRVRQHWALVAAVVVTGGAVFMLRFLALNGFPNDHFIHLAGAQQILLGDWPTRDFVDPGMPLMYLASAAWQLVAGRTLLAEAQLVAAAYAVAAGLTMVLARVVSGRLWVALVAVALEVLIFPRSYSYPKLLLYACGISTMWWYARAPSTRRLWALATMVIVAFLFRHDHGAYLGAASLFTIMLAGRGGFAAGALAAARFAGLVVVLLLPYLAYVEYAGGLRRYVTSALEFSRAEALQTALELPGFRLDGPWLADTNADMWIFVLFHALPVAALAAVALLRWHGGGRSVREEVALLAPVALLALMVNVGFLRDPLRARLPDAVVPAAVLAAWLAGRALDYRRDATGLLACAALVVLAAPTVLAVDAIGRPMEQLDRMGAFAGIRRMPEIVRERTGELADRFSERQMPSDYIAALRPVFSFLDRCTTSEHYLLVTPYAPEIYVYAGRRFAGGHAVYFPGYFERGEDQALMLARVTRQPVAFAIKPAVATEFNRMFPALGAYLDATFEPVAELPVDGDVPLWLAANRRMAPRRRDPPSGWPCFR